MKTLKKIISIILFIFGALFALLLLPGIIKLIGSTGDIESSKLIGMWVAQVVLVIVDLLIFKIAIGLWKNEKMKVKEEASSDS